MYQSGELKILSHEFSLGAGFLLLRGEWEPGGLLSFLLTPSASSGSRYTALSLPLCKS